MWAFWSGRDTVCVIFAYSYPIQRAHGTATQCYRIWCTCKSQVARLWMRRRGRSFPSCLRPLLPPLRSMARSTSHCWLHLRVAPSPGQQLSLALRALQLGTPTGAPSLTRRDPTTGIPLSITSSIFHPRESHPHPYAGWCTPYALGSSRFPTVLHTAIVSLSPKPSQMEPPLIWAHHLPCVFCS